NKSTVLIFMGEHYHHPGTGFIDVNARDFLRLYDELGDDFLRGLNGWFCGLIADLNHGKITLFNDRYGMSRVYFNEGKDEFIFASEAKSLLRVRPALRMIEGGALAQYLRFNCVMENRTLFKGISLLPAGSSWIFENDVVPRK